MHGTFDIPVKEFKKLIVTDNHKNYEQAGEINEEGTILRTVTPHDTGTWLNKKIRCYRMKQDRQRDFN